MKAMTTSGTATTAMMIQGIMHGSVQRARQQAGSRAHIARVEKAGLFVGFRAAS
jgi:hypothetical protein